MRAVLIIMVLAMILTAGAITPLDVVRNAGQAAHTPIAISGLNASAAQALVAMNDLGSTGHYQWETEIIVQGDEMIDKTLLNFSNSNEGLPESVKA